MKTRSNIRPMKLSLEKMEANNINNFDLSNMPDDVQINADGSTPSTPAATTAKPKISLDSIQKGIDTVGAAANIAQSIKIRKSDEVCGKKPLITFTSAGKAKLKAYNECIAGKGTVAAPATYTPPPATTPEPDNKIMGMPKPLFFGIAGLMVVGVGLFVYKKSTYTIFLDGRLKRWYRWNLTIKRLI